MKHIIAALFAGSLILGSMAAVAADTASTDPAATETKPQKAKKKTKKKAKSAKKKTEDAAHTTKDKVNSAVKNRTTPDPASPNESNPAGKK